MVKGHLTNVVTMASCFPAFTFLFLYKHTFIRLTHFLKGTQILPVLEGGCSELALHGYSQQQQQYMACSEYFVVYNMGTAVGTVKGTVNNSKNHSTELICVVATINK